jgi:hypothetical protein
MRLVSAAVLRARHARPRVRFRFRGSPRLRTPRGARRPTTPAFDALGLYRETFVEVDDAVESVRTRGRQ